MRAVCFHFFKKKANESIMILTFLNFLNFYSALIFFSSKIQKKCDESNVIFIFCFSTFSFLQCSHVFFYGHESSVRLFWKCQNKVQWGQSVFFYFFLFFTINFGTFLDQKGDEKSVFCGEKKCNENSVILNLQKIGHESSVILPKKKLDSWNIFKKIGGALFFF